MLYNVIAEFDVWSKDELDVNEYASMLDVMILEIERHNNGKTTIRFNAENSALANDFLDGITDRGIEIL